MEIRNRPVRCTGPLDLQLSQDQPAQLLAAPKKLERFQNSNPLLCCVSPFLASHDPTSTRFLPLPFQTQKCEAEAAAPPPHPPPIKPSICHCRASHARGLRCSTPRGTPPATRNPASCACASARRQGRPGGSLLPQARGMHHPWRRRRRRMRRGPPISPGGTTWTVLGVKMESETNRRGRTASSNFSARTGDAIGIVVLRLVCSCR